MHVDMFVILSILILIMTNTTSLFLIKSKTRAKLLTILFSDVQKKYYLTELANIAEVSAGNAQRELEYLLKEGLIDKEKEPGRLLVFYVLNKKHSLFYELQSLVLKTFTKKGRLKNISSTPKIDKKLGAQTVKIPLLGSVPCGAPLLAEENVENKFQISTALAKPPHKYFLLEAKGDSMDLAGIDDGDLVLVRQQVTAQNGDRIVALIDGEVTIKEYQASKGIIILKPKSRNLNHKQIVLTNDFQVQGIVVAVIPNIKESIK